MQPLLTKDTAIQQKSFADYCRTGEEPHLEGVTSDRLHHYRRLVYNVIDDTLRTAYPLTNNLLEEEEWDDMVHDFFSNHKCQSHKVWEMPYELYEYLAEVVSPLKEKYPFFLELLWFEWLEVQMFMMEDVENDEYNNEGDFVQDKIVFNLEYTIEQLAYPLHKKRTKDITQDDKGNYYVLIFRDREDGSVQFLDLSVFYAWVLEQLLEQGVTVKELLPIAAQAFQLPEEELQKHVIHFMEVLKEKRFILGFK
ncbi:MAG: putative DNA-binding domain-containing protein [Flavipsychrobacter sp.]